MDLQLRLRDWIHETPLSLCDMGADTCDDWPLAIALDTAIKSNSDEDWKKAADLARECYAIHQARENDE